MSRLAAAALALCLISPVAFAQEALPGPDTSLCDTGPLDPEAVMGDGWALTVSRFKVRTEASPTYASEIKRLPARLYYVQGYFTLYGLPDPISPFTFLEMPPDHGPWRWSDDPVLTLPDDPEVGRSSADVEAAMGCTLSQFPRLASSVETTSDDGRQFTHTVMLVALSERMMIGAWDWRSRDDGAPIHYTAGITMLRDPD
ncbi:MAG: hypothetical protein VX874_18580 [Pseudomonadota bacterium]|nr:hypothetical protein [Pseudomonadota bacterium]